MIKQETPVVPEKNMIEFLAKYNDDKYFQVNFFLKENIIRIETIDTTQNSGNKFINELTLEDWINLNQYFASFNSVNEIFQKLDKMKSENFSIVKNEKITNLKIKFDNKYILPILLPLKEVKLIKKNNLNDNNIIEENEDLKNDKKDLVDRINYLEDELNKIKLSLPFNLFDDTLYELENVYNNLDSSELISKRQYLGLKFIIGQDKNLSKFWEKYQNINNILLIIKTTKNRIFGVFYQKYPYGQNIGYYGAKFGTSAKVPMYNENSFYQSSPYGYGAGEVEVAGYAPQFIFDSKNYKNNSFIFSLDNKKIYYSDLFHNDSYEEPNFNVQYDRNNSIFKGMEYESYNNSNNNQNQKEVSSNQGAAIAVNQNSYGEISTKVRPIYHINSIPVQTVQGSNKVRQQKIQPVIQKQNKNQFILSQRKDFIISNLEILDIKF